MVANGEAAAEVAEQTKPQATQDLSHRMVCHRRVAVTAAVHLVERQGRCCLTMMSPPCSSPATPTAGPTGVCSQWS